MVRLRPKPNQTLSVTVDAATHCNEGSFRLSYVPSSGHEQPLACGTRLHSIFAVTSGEIVVDFFSHLGHGGSDETFVILFERKYFIYYINTLVKKCLSTSVKILFCLSSCPFLYRVYKDKILAASSLNIIYLLTQTQFLSFNISLLFRLPYM